jgi:metal-responsive CopG/Arc/MetJ family transcriptional regulator
MPVFSVSLPNSLWDWLEKSRGEKKRSAYIADLLERDLVEKGPVRKKRAESGKRHAAHMRVMRGGRA